MIAVQRGVPANAKSPEPLQTWPCAQLSDNGDHSGASFALAAFAIPSAQAQTFTVLHNFLGPDGSLPTATLTLDRAGNLYGTTQIGGSNGNGTVFKMTHGESG